MNLTYDHDLQLELDLDGVKVNQQRSLGSKSYCSDTHRPIVVSGSLNWLVDIAMGIGSALRLER